KETYWKDFHVKLFPFAHCYPDNYFDGVFQRYLTLGITKDKWEYVISELVRVTKPGGFVECVEASNTERLGPKGQILFGGFFQAMVHRVSNLSGKFQRAGLQVITETPVSYPIGWGGNVGKLNLINFKMIFESMKPFLMKAFNMSSGEFDQLNHDAVEEYPVFESYWNNISVVGKKL
ncbi:hypothetical protein HK096_000441, partial [Nowakowskiella sp. JEL0078]